jgi:UDP:flavonoid glycosyltransferase YjiC (YdhE family)
MMSAEKPLMLFFPFDVLAHYMRCLQLAQWFSPYYRIVFQDSERYRSFVEAQGFETFSCVTLDADTVQECVRRFDFSWMNEADLYEVTREQVWVMNDYKPALVLGDAVPTLRIATEQAGIPYISLMNGYMSRHYAHVRQMSWRYPLYRYLKMLPQSLLSALTRKGEALSFQKIHQPFRKLRERFGLEEKGSYFDETEGDVNFICDLPSLFPQVNLPEHYHFVPPLFHTGKKEGADDWSSRLDKNRKTLFVSMGSTGEWNHVDCLNDPSFSRYNIITAGDRQRVLHAAHILSADFIQPEDILPFTDLVICHGGNGTVYQALSYGIPLLCRTSHFEQEWNVDALQRNGLGASLDHVHTPGEYHQLIETYLPRRNNRALTTIRESIRAAKEKEGAQLHRLIRNLWRPDVPSISGQEEIHFARTHQTKAS